MRPSITFIALTLWLSPSYSKAASYCWWSGGNLSDGQTVTESLRIVVSSVPREPIPGKSDKRPWCTQNRSSIGGHSSNKIIEKPKLGVVKADGYRISFKGDRVGKDHFTIERRWLNWTNNQWQTGKIIYEIDIVKQAF